MKIAFINNSVERLGVAYISALLKANGHQVKLFADPQLFDDGYHPVKWLSRIFDYKKRLISDLKAYKPDLIGISVVTDFYQWACTIARMAKQEMDCPIIFGGIHPTSVPERVIKNDFVDMVCVGEGEYPMLELANSLKRGEIDYSVKNIWFKKDGRIIQNEIRPLIEDLDSLPMPDKELYYSASPHFSQCYYIMTSRGCQYSCSYCCHSYLKGLYKDKGKYLRYRSIDSIIKELLQAKREYGIKLVRFWDDCFPINTEWLKEFTEKYKKKINLPYICYLHTADISSESVKYLKESGCCEINLAIHWNRDINLTVLHRGVSSNEVERAVDAINDRKINISVDTILGIPGQTEEDNIGFLEFCLKKRIRNIYFNWLRYFPKIDISIQSKQGGFLAHAKYAENIDGFNARVQSLGGDVANKESVKFILLARLTKIIPRSVTTFIIRNRIYHFFPGFIPLHLAIYSMNSSLDSCDHNFLRRMDIRRYKYYITKILIHFLPSKNRLS